MQKRNWNRYLVMSALGAQSLCCAYSARAATEVLSWEGYAARAASGFGPQIPFEIASASSLQAPADRSFTVGNQSENAYATFRAGAGSIGVTARAVFVSSQPAGYAHYEASAYAYASSSDIVTVTSSSLAFGEVIPFSVFSRLSYAYSADVSAFVSTVALTASYPSITYTYNATTYRYVNGIRLATGVALSTNRCFGILDNGNSCGTPVFDGDPFFGLAHDDATFSGQIAIGDEVEIKMSLVASVKGIIANSNPLSSFTGSAVSSITAMNSLHTYLYSPEDSVSFVGLDGSSYALPVPEPSSSWLVALGLPLVLLKKRPGGFSIAARHP